MKLSNAYANKENVAICQWLSVVSTSSLPPTDPQQLCRRFRRRRVQVLRQIVCKNELYRIEIIL